MARPLRIEYPGAAYHITNRGNDKKAVFKDDHDRETFLKILAFVNKRYIGFVTKETAHPCLTTDWVLGQFSRTRGKAEKEYRQFVKWGIGKETIWNEVKGQALLGEDDFVDSLADYLRRHKDIPEIPKSQRYANRPALEKIFSQSMLDDRRKRDRKIAEAVEKYGYTQRSIADHLGVHSTYVSRILCGHYKR